MPAYPTSQRVTVPLLGWEPSAGHRIGGRCCTDHGHAADELTHCAGHHEALRPGTGHVGKCPTSDVSICATLGSSILKLELVGAGGVDGDVEVSDQASPGHAGLDAVAGAGDRAHVL